MPAKVRDYKKLASDIIQIVGGKENISNATRCATRLRLVLKETPADAKKTVEKLPGVITVVENSGQFQVVIGNHVGDVYGYVSEELHLGEGQDIDEDMPKQSVLNRVIATMSAVFAPFVYILAAAGILQGILILIRLVAPAFSSTGTSQVLDFMSWAPFTFLPIFIAVTAAKHFKCNEFIALLCCCALVSPTWADMAAKIADGETIKFLCFKLSETTYTSSVLPPIFLVWILSYVEKFVSKHLHENIRQLFTPLICLVVMVPLTLLIIGPVSQLAANGIANGFNYLVSHVPVLAAALVGGVWQVFVIFGVHWGITPMILANHSLYGQDSFQAFQTLAVVSQMAAAFGVFLKSRNKEFKGVALSAGITGIFGITEPAIYGITLRLKKPFVCACVSGGVAAIVTSFFQSQYYVYAGLPGLLTIVNAINPKQPSSFIGEVVGVVIAIVLTIILIQIVGFDDPVEESEEEAETKEAEVVEAKKETPVKKTTESSMKVSLVAPMDGEVFPLKEVEDQVFSSELLGRGVAIRPSGKKVYAPCDATVESIFDTKHAIGLKMENGLEVMIHVGLDTVQLEGKPFELKTRVGAKVKQGDLLLEFDAKAIKEAGYSTVTPVIITNLEEEQDILPYPETDKKVGEPLFAVLV